MIELAEGTHPYSQRLSQAELPMIIVGDEVFKRKDSDAIQAALNKLA